MDEKQLSFVDVLDAELEALSSESVADYRAGRYGESEPKVAQFFRKLNAREEWAAALLPVQVTPSGLLR